MKVIKYMKKRVFNSGRHKLRNIINNQNVNTLIKTKKIILGIIANRIRILYFKQICFNIKYTLIRIQLFSHYSNSINQVGFSHAGTSIQKQRIKNSFSRFISYTDSRSTSQFITIRSEERRVGKECRSR